MSKDYPSTNVSVCHDRLYPKLNRPLVKDAELNFRPQTESDCHLVVKAETESAAVIPYEFTFILFSINTLCEKGSKKYPSRNSLETNKLLLATVPLTTVVHRQILK